MYVFLLFKGTQGTVVCLSFSIMTNKQDTPLSYLQVKNYATITVCTKLKLRVYIVLALPSVGCRKVPHLWTPLPFWVLTLCVILRHDDSNQNAELKLALQL